MQLSELVRAVPGFPNMTHTDRVKLFAWHLHTHCELVRFDSRQIRECFDKLNVSPPSNLSQCLASLVAKKPPELLKDSKGYRLEAKIRGIYDKRFGVDESGIAVAKMLEDLPGKVTDQAEKVFLSEAICCYRHKAFRAAIVMTWNLAYDHLLSWLLADATRLAAFNARIPICFPKKPLLVITKKEDFEELKESEVVKVCSSARLFSKNIGKILEEKLTKRNMSAHPSLVEVTRYQAEDTISDLANNVILRLT